MVKLDIGGLLKRVGVSQKSVDVASGATLAQDLATIDQERGPWFLGVVEVARGQEQTVAVGREVYRAVQSSVPVYNVYERMGVANNIYPFGLLGEVRNNGQLMDAIYKVAVTDASDKFSTPNFNRSNPAAAAEVARGRKTLTEKVVSGTALAMGLADAAVEGDREEGVMFAFILARSVGFIHDEQISHKLVEVVDQNPALAVKVHQAILDETREGPDTPQGKIVAQLRETTKGAYEMEKTRLAREAERVRIEASAKLEEAEIERNWSEGFGRGLEAGMAVTAYQRRLEGGSVSPSHWVVASEPGSSDPVKVDPLGVNVLENPQIAEGSELVRTPKRFLTVVKEMVGGLVLPGSGVDSRYGKWCEITRRTDEKQKAEIRQKMVVQLRGMAGGFARAVMNRVLEPNKFPQNDRRLKEMGERELSWIAQALILAYGADEDDYRIVCVLSQLMPKLNETQQMFLGGALEASQEG